MEIISNKKNGRLTVELNGELDENSAPYTRTTLDSLISKGSFSCMVLDLSRLSFMDSTGVGVLFGRYKALKTMGKLLAVKSPTRAVDKVLKLSGIYDIIPKLAEEECI